MIFKISKKLSKLGIIGINKRNADYIMRYNPRKNFRLVDNKLITKKLAIQHGIAVPALYGVISSEGQLGNFIKIVEDKNDFVVKPANGGGGYGITVITGRFKEYFQKSNGLLLKQDDIEVHISNILTGLFSLAGQQDEALVEYRVIADDFFSDISFQGVPDIRVIVFLGYPIMAMLRLPTRASDGKANLHQGAIGVGINIVTGMTTKAVNAKTEIIDFHPDTLKMLPNLTLPRWDELLLLAAKCYELTGLGYIGVDIVLDRFHGPLM